MVVAVSFVEVGELENVHDLITGESQLLYNTPFYYINIINNRAHTYTKCERVPKGTAKIWQA